MADRLRRIRRSRRRAHAGDGLRQSRRPVDDGARIARAKHRRRKRDDHAAAQGHSRDRRRRCGARTREQRRKRAADSHSPREGGDRSGRPRQGPIHRDAFARATQSARGDHVGRGDPAAQRSHVDGDARCARGDRAADRAHVADDRGPARFESRHHGQGQSEARALRCRRARLEHRDGVPNGGTRQATRGRCRDAIRLGRRRPHARRANRDEPVRQRAQVSPTTARRSGSASTRRSISRRSP